MYLQPLQRPIINGYSEKVVGCRLKYKKNFTGIYMQNKKKKIFARNIKKFKKRDLYLQPTTANHTKQYPIVTTFAQ